MLRWDGHKKESALLRDDSYRVGGLTDARASKPIFGVAINIDEITNISHF